jgi:hypothetical protein
MENKMTTSMTFMNRIKGLTQGLISGNGVELNRPPSHEIEILALPGQSNWQASSSGAIPIRSGATASSGTDQRWSITQGSGRDSGHTRSNLG